MSSNTTKFSKTYQPKRRRGSSVKTQVRKLMAGLANAESTENAKLILDELMNKFLGARSIHIQFAAWKEVMKYIYPQKRAIDVTSQVVDTINSSIFIIPAFKEIGDNEENKD